MSTNTPCQYGSKCYRKNPDHFAKFSHPCKYGSKCYRKNPEHLAKFSHPETKKSPCEYGSTCYRKNPEHLAKFSHPETDSKTNWLGPNPKATRKAIQEETFQHLKNPKIITWNQRKEAKKTTVMTNGKEESLKVASIPASFRTKIIMFRGDCGDAAIWLMKDSINKVMIINMANANHPGGGYKNGAGAQEENLCRRSNLSDCVEESRSQYPIPDTGAHYVQNLYLFRKGEDDHYALMSSTLEFSCVGVAAIRDPILENGSLNSSDEKRTRRKIDTLLNVALANGHTRIILSALGCGAFHNPPHQIATLFKEALQSSQFKNKFEIVMFAIYDDHNGTNYSPFRNVFDSSIAVEVANLSTTTLSNL
jgi:uncharacterized protein (TIGR02452 family)